MSTLHALGQSELFSVATLIYTRLRRVSGRVIDVMYLVENTDYARYVVQLALATQDAELHHHISRLEAILVKLAPQYDRTNDIQNDLSIDKKEESEELTDSLEETHEPTEEEIYQAQVAHHYIGALR